MHGRRGAQRDGSAQSQSLCSQTWFIGVTVLTAPGGACTDLEAVKQEAATSSDSLSTKVPYQLRDLDIYVIALGPLEDISVSST